MSKVCVCAQWHKCFLSYSLLIFCVSFRRACTYNSKNLSNSRAGHFCISLLASRSHEQWNSSLPNHLTQLFIFLLSACYTHILNAQADLLLEAYFLSVYRHTTLCENSFFSHREWASEGVENCRWYSRHLKRKWWDRLQVSCAIQALWQVRQQIDPPSCESRPRSLTELSTPAALQHCCDVCCQSKTCLSWFYTEQTGVFYLKSWKVTKY